MRMALAKREQRRNIPVEIRGVRHDVRTLHQLSADCRRQLTD
jgi:hypothetical protein